MRHDHAPGLCTTGLDNRRIDCGTPVASSYTFTRPCPIALCSLCMTRRSTPACARCSKHRSTRSMPDLHTLESQDSFNARGPAPSTLCSAPLRMQTTCTRAVRITTTASLRTGGRFRLSLRSTSGRRIRIRGMTRRRSSSRLSLALFHTRLLMVWGTPLGRLCRADPIPVYLTSSSQ